MVNGKTKGNAFERKVYKDLRDITEAKRSLGSGSSDEASDISTKKFVAECKCYRKVSDTMLRNWWAKLIDEMDWKKDHRQPVIIYKENFADPKVMMIEKIRGLNMRCIIYYEDWLLLVRRIEQ